MARCSPTTRGGGRDGGRGGGRGDGGVNGRGGGQGDGGDTGRGDRRVNGRVQIGGVNGRDDRGVNGRSDGRGGGRGDRQDGGRVDGHADAHNDARDGGTPSTDMSDAVPCKQRPRGQSLGPTRRLAGTERKVCVNRLHPVMIGMKTMEMDLITTEIAQTKTKMETSKPQTLLNVLKIFDLTWTYFLGYILGSFLGYSLVSFRI